jgi:hypothetical protein
LAGRGEAGVGEAPAGDLFLRVRLAKHPDLRVEEGDLYYDLNIAPWEAVLGTKVSVPALDGRVNIKIPAGTQNGQKMRIREHVHPWRRRNTVPIRRYDIFGPIGGKPTESVVEAIVGTSAPRLLSFTAIRGAPRGVLEITVKPYGRQTWLSHWLPALVAASD